jgi:hypothetical protein
MLLDDLTACSKYGIISQSLSKSFSIKNIDHLTDYSINIINLKMVESQNNYPGRCVDEISSLWKSRLASQ